MQQLAKSARIFSSPTVLILTVWSVLLIVIAIGPIDYSNQPSAAVLAIVFVGISLFMLAQRVGAWCFRTWFTNRANGTALRIDRLSLVVAISSCAGIVGIGLIALDRIVLSGVSNSSYAELLRCAPDLIDIVEIKRTPLLYAGYPLFSFGYASVVLFLLKGEQIRGWAAALAQFSILSPVGYALLYAGRMPILFVIILMIAVVFVRIAQGRRALPAGHHLFIKLIILVLVFCVYSSAIWLSRASFCLQVKANGAVQELLHRLRQREAEPVNDREQSAVPGDAINAADLAKVIAAGEAGRQTDRRDAVTALLLTMDQAWHIKPSGYVIAAIQSGRLSPATAVTVLSTYFYLTHGVRILDTTWRERDRFSPHWGVYQIGVLSPILRVFFPGNDELLALKTELQSAGIHGFFPTVWAAAYIDFGMVGAVIYVLIWGFAAGWSAFGVRHCASSTPTLLLTFIIATILLSPVQGPLGIANSALVLLSLIIVGLAADLGGAAQNASATARPAGG